MTEIAEAIVAFGVVPVVIAFFIYYVITTRKSHEKMQEENSRRNKDTLAVILQLAGRVENVAENTKAVHTPAEELENTKLNLSITQWLNKLVTDTGSNHAMYVAFHNGGRMNSNRYMQKMSITHESFCKYTTPLMSELQNFPRAYLASTISEVTEKGHLYVNDTDKLEEADPNAYNLYKMRGIKSVAIAEVRTNDGISLGFLVLEFKNQTDVSGDRKLQKALRDVAIKVGTALEISK